MRYTNRRRRNRKKELYTKLGIGAVTILAVIVLVLCLLQTRSKVCAYEKEAYGRGIYRSEFFADNLCVSEGEEPFPEFKRHDEFHGSLLFDVTHNEVLLSDKVCEKLYPASTTKLLTAYIAMKYGDMDSEVRVSKNAVDIPKDSSSAKLMEGDRLMLRDLVYGLMLPSGNDSAIAIAEYMAGDVESFADMMNKEAKLLGATGTHFVNPHGYQNKNHYTTAYDLYLFFNACLQYEEFRQIISTKTRSPRITNSTVGSRDVTWSQTNLFVTGGRSVPKGVTVIGGKTGTTFDAGACLIQYVKGADDTYYIAIIMGASSRRNLYDNMTYLLNAIPKKAK